MSRILEKGYIDKKEKGSGEYQDLYLEGIELLQKLSGGIWTDYNEHDPGVTIFENLAYTLTNLSYKVDMPIRDILYESKKGKLVSGDNGFFIASEILTTNPIVKEDYRKILVDGIKNVKNVWIRTLNQDHKKESSGKLNLRGLYRVFVEMYEYDNVKSELLKEEKRVKDEVRQIFHSQRNLCEDLYDVTILRPLKLQMELHLTVDMEADGESVFGQVYYDINDFLTHEAKFESLWEIQQQNIDFNSVHTGPALDNGFMRDQELRKQVRKIYIGDLTKIISKVPGVVSIDKFEVIGGKRDRSSKNIIVSSSETPRFELPDQKHADGKLRFKTADISLIPNTREIKKRYVSIEAEHYGNFKTVSESQNRVEIPEGESLGISSYYSVREQLPTIYGIGRFGLPSSASEKRKAQAKQLKAYLLPFDQLMANFLAQLNNVYTLYNPNETKLETYFYQVLEDMRNMVDTRNRDNERTDEQNDRLAKIADKSIQAVVKLDHSNPKPILGQWKDTLNELNANSDTEAIDRLNEVTDTMLARYAEDFPTYVLQKINTNCFGKHFTDEDFDKKLLRWKRQLISNYGHLSYNRARSIDYLNPKEAENNQKVSFTLPVVIEKIAILLGIKHPELRNFSEIMKHKKFDAKLMMDTSPDDFEEDDLKILEKLYRKMREISPRNSENDTNLNTLLKEGVVAKNYRVKNGREVGRKDELQLSETNPLILMSHSSTKKLNERVKPLAIKLLKKLNEKTEGIHLLEHLLLAPPASGNHFGFSFEVLLKKYSDGKEDRVSFTHVERISSLERNENLDLIRSGDNEGKLPEVRSKRIDSKSAYKVEIINDSKDVLAICSTEYASKEASELVVKALKALIENNKGCPISELKYRAFLNETEVDESFFSFQMSFILPAWPVRFQQESFKTQFNNILYQQVPIHIHYDTHWLTLSEMSKFEEAYFKWLGLLKDEKKIEDRMQSALQLYNIIQEFQSSGKIE